MLFLFYIILFLYVALTLLYAVTKPDPTSIPAWPLLTVPKDASLDLNCLKNDDCPPFHVCLGGKCVPKLQQTDDCDPDTGQWISYVYGGVDFAICTCHKPDLVTQRLFGGNCDVQVGCGVHGTYLAAAGKCQCDYGYQDVGLTFQKRPMSSFLQNGPCEADEVDATFLGFHPDYKPPTKCLKRPCSFDALTGKPLKHSEFDPTWGCVCDPRYGLFGVLLEGDGKKYLNTEGYDACALVLDQEPNHPQNVELVTYFYLGKREPLSIIVFRGLQRLATPFTGRDFMIAQKLWRYDYAQYFFKTTRRLRARQRYTTTVPSFDYIDYPVEFHYSDDYQPPACHTVPHVWKKYKNSKIDIYKLLYWNPVC